MRPTEKLMCSAMTAARTLEPNARYVKSSAYHEAGHAVVAILDDMPVIDVRLAERSEIEAARRARLPYFNRGEVRIDACRASWWDGVYTIAGPVADARYRHWSLLSVLLAGGAQDLADAREAATPRLRPDLTSEQIKQEIGRGINEYVRLARQLVSKEWRWIVRVADALLQRGRLTGREVKRLSGRRVRA